MFISDHEGPKFTLCLYSQCHHHYSDLAVINALAADLNGASGSGSPLPVIVIFLPPPPLATPGMP